MKHELRDILDQLGHGLGRTLDARKLWQWVKKDRHPSPETLDRLALLAGFQSWKELRDALEEGGDAPAEDEDGGQ